MKPDVPTPGAWGTHALDGVAEPIRFGPLVLHLAEAAGEVRVAHARDDDAGSPAPSDGLDWSRWAPRDWTGEVDLVPAFPDRPVVVDPQDDFHLLEGAEARIFVRLPLWVGIEAVTRAGTRTPLVRLPTVVGSDTWWGSVAEGELAYWLTTLARRTIDPDHFSDHLVICPLQLVNRSAGTLEVSQIAVRVDHMTMYSDGRALWADETRVRYDGELAGSRLTMTGRPPAEAPGARLLVPPRLTMSRGFNARTFTRLRSSLQQWF